MFKKLMFGFSLINASSNSNSMKYSYRYSSSAPYEIYKPEIRIEDASGHLHIASGTVIKYLTKPL
ncbi:hypothetical protein ABE096_16615 [Robertmurraya massiliosenegalensis]|uniref:hypothetical protein n=1 Tax=Robertmurraya TaxID=2837507 RepID=UPI0039A60D14